MMPPADSAQAPPPVGFLRGHRRSGTIYRPERTIETVPRFQIGDRVRIDIPDEQDPDHSRHHGRHGEIVAMIEDDAGRETGDERDSVLYRVEFDSGNQADFRQGDLRPPFDT